MFGVPWNFPYHLILKDAESTIDAEALSMSKTRPAKLLGARNKGAMEMSQHRCDKKVSDTFLSLMYS